MLDGLVAEMFPFRALLGFLYVRAWFESLINKRDRGGLEGGCGHLNLVAVLKLELRDIKKPEPMEDLCDCKIVN